MEYESEEDKIIKALEAKKAEKIKESKANLREVARLQELRSLSWIKMLQEPEYTEKLKRLEKNQKAAFEQLVKKNYPYLKEEQEELFCHYFTELLNEKTKSMDKWLEENNYKQEKKDD